MGKGAGKLLTTRLGNFSWPACGEDDLAACDRQIMERPDVKGTDHTKEMVPLLAYSPSMKQGLLEDQKSFAVIGATIADNFGVAMPEGTIGESLLDQLK